jgi:hypothetical protein
MFKTSCQQLGMVAASGLVLAASACIPAEDKCDAATVQSVQLAATLAVGGANNTFYLSTPATARSACDAHYQLTFRWAASPRNTTDGTQPPLSNLAQAFHVDADTMWWFHDPAARVGEAIALINWQIDFVDHNAVATSPQSQYYIRTGLPTGGAGDSVFVSGRIDYYPK